MQQSYTLEEALLLIDNAASDQPREPAGTPGGGRFAKIGGSGVRTIRHGNLEAKFSKRTTKRIDGPSIALPNYKQHDEHSCSFIAALSVVQHHDPTISPREVLRTVRPTKPGGLDGHKLLLALKQLGVSAKFKSDLTIAKLRQHVEQGTPVMLTVWPQDWGSDHWTVVQGFSGKGAAAKIHLSNYKSMSLREFRKEWFDKGEGIICRPSQSNK